MATTPPNTTVTFRAGKRDSASENIPRDHSAFFCWRLLGQNWVTWPPLTASKMSFQLFKPFLWVWERRWLEMSENRWWVQPINNDGHAFKARVLLGFSPREIKPRMCSKEHIQGFSLLATLLAVAKIGTFLSFSRQTDCDNSTTEYCGTIERTS